MCLLQSLTLDKNYEQAVAPELLPDGYRCTKTYLRLPKIVNTLNIFGYQKNNFVLPSYVGLDTLHLRTSALHVLPEKLKVLNLTLGQNPKFGPDGASTLSGITLPREMEELTIDVAREGHYSISTFSDELAALSLKFPPSIRKLTIGKYNKNLKNLKFPANLETLVFGQNFDKTLETSSLPRKLRSLTLGDDFQNGGKMFNIGSVSPATPVQEDVQSRTDDAAATPVQEDVQSRTDDAAATPVQEYFQSRTNDAAATPVQEYVQSRTDGAAGAKKMRYWPGLFYAKAGAAAASSLGLLGLATAWHGTHANNLNVTNLGTGQVADFIPSGNCTRSHLLDDYSCENISKAFLGHGANTKTRDFCGNTLPTSVLIDPRTGRFEQGRQVAQ